MRGGVSPPEVGTGEGVLGRGLNPSSENVLLFDLKMEHFGAAFKLDITEETRTQLQEEAIAPGCILHSLDYN